MFESEIRLDNTKRSTFRECLRKGYWQYICHWQTEMGSTALRFGSTWHGFQEGFYGTLIRDGWDAYDKAVMNAIVKGKEVWDRESAKQDFYDDYRTFDLCTQMFFNYVKHFGGDAEFLKVLHTEQVFACPIELETGIEKSYFSYLPPIVFTGKLDMQAELNMSNWIIEHKSTGQPLEKQSFRLNRSAQIMGYSYAASRVLNFHVEGCLISFAMVVARKSPKTGMYGTPTMDFKRVPQLFNKADLQEWKLSFLHTCADIYNCAESGFWPMNLDHCYSAFGGCPYIRLCQQNRPPDETNFEGFVEIEWDVEKEAV